MAFGMGPLVSMARIVDTREVPVVVLPAARRAGLEESRESCNDWLRSLLRGL